MPISLERVLRLLRVRQMQEVIVDYQTLELRRPTEVIQGDIFQKSRIFADEAPEFGELVICDLGLLFCLRAL